MPNFYNQSVLVWVVLLTNIRSNKAPFALWLMDLSCCMKSCQYSPGQISAITLYVFFHISSSLFNHTIVQKGKLIQRRNKVSAWPASALCLWLMWSWCSFTCWGCPSKGMVTGNRSKRQLAARGGGAGGCATCPISHTQSGVKNCRVLILLACMFAWLNSSVDLCGHAKLSWWLSKFPCWAHTQPLYILSITPWKMVRRHLPVNCSTVVFCC